MGTVRKLAKTVEFQKFFEIVPK
ncbi:MAG: hypothetical protein XD53_0481, partial [Petrotoga mobilis]